MGDTKLCLVLLLSAVALAHADDDASCLMAKRYKPFHKYEFLYEAESLNFLNGAVNGPKGSCKVEIEVPGPCHYIVRTTECTLSEVADFDAAGEPVFVPAATTDAFKAAMEKNPLKVTVEGDNIIKLFPEDDEPINILNIKRGMISGFAVPVMEEERNKRMPTIYGLCKTDYTVNAREDIATDVTLTRDLSRCDQFRPVSDYTSPLALITGMHYPLAQLIKSTQTCNYKFDNAEHHPVFGECLENHILVPFSHKGKHGVTNVSKQKATLLAVSEYNERVFDPGKIYFQTLTPHASVDKSPIQDKDAALAVLRELAGLSKTDDGQKRAHLAHRIVSMVRKMSAETLAAGVPEALEISRSLTYQALFQCGTPECSGAIMQILRTFDSSSMEIDATVYAMGLMPNPSRQLVHDMLEMAKFKQSKPIFYGASNAVKKLYQAEGKVTPEIEAVANFALEQIGDCTGDQEHIFMSLKVIGNMAAAMGAASPALKSAVIQCVNQPAATPEVQLAAIQAYRQTTLPEEGRQVLMQVLLDGAAPLQKRVAAYLVLMKDPQPSELSQLAAALPIEENQQAKSFVISHVTNILSSTAPETQELRQKILDALQGNEVGTVMDPTKFSRNYKVGSLEGNMIFDGASYLPKEVVLDMALNAFGYDVDMIEIGMEGKGLEPTVEALFGANGFFPDTVMKTIYYAADRMPGHFSQTLKNILPSLRNDRKKRQSSQNLLRELSRNVNKLFRDLKAQDAPEAMVYMRLLGMELGYLKTKDMEEMAYSAALMIDNLLKMFPTDFIKGLLTSADNELFAHYIFMDNEFYLPTGPGVPLRVALSGTFTPGIKGGVHLSSDMSEVAFMPSAGIEFVTEVGAHFPDFVQSGLEMHTNIYHESGLKAKVSVSNSNIKLTIPAPQGPTKLVSLTNSLVSVHGAEIKSIPTTGERVDVTECTPVFAGMKYCTALQYSDAMHTDESPYFPFTGDSKLAIELHPTGEISEYIANIDHSYEDKTDKVTLTLKAEGKYTAEATATVKFNRQQYTVEADLQIPDYDLEVGLRLGSVDPNTKGKATHSVQIDLVNKNIPQASLVALAKIEGMKDATLDLQLLVPVLKADAKVSAHLHRAEGLTLELETDVKLPETSSAQKIVLKYDADKLEAEIKSDVSSEIQNIIPHIDEVKASVNGLLDAQIGQSGMTFRDVLAKSVETTNAYLEKLEAELPYVQNVRLPSLPELSLPERLYLNAEADAKYHFGKHYYTIAIPLPLGGKSSGDLNFPAALTTPHLTVPQLGLEVASVAIPLPEVFIPEQVSVSVPVFGKAEVSAKVHSNLYNLEADVSAGRDPVDHPSYSANVELTGSCPVDIFCFKAEASALLAGTPGDSLKAEVKTHVNHKLIDASVSIVEVATIADKFNLKSNSKIEATSPLGVQVSLEYHGDAGLNTEEISGNGNLEASLRAGPVYGAATISQTIEFFPLKPEAKIDSSLKIDSTLVKAQNTFVAAFANGELSATSNTVAFDDTLLHHAEVTFKDSTLAGKSDTKADALGLKIQNVAEASAGAGAVNIKMETSADHAENRIHSLVTAVLDVNGLAVNSDADVKLAENTATHKASLTLNKDGLTTNGATSLQSPLKLENTFSGTIDASKVDLNIDIKGEFADMHLENHAELKAEAYKADLTGSLKAAYGEQELKHTYEIKYADMTANAKCSTTGMLLGSHLSQNTEVFVPGLAIKISNDARFNSQVLRFDTTSRATAVPFSFNLDAIANADADLTMYGKHTAQVYTKFLMKAEPLAFAHSHECRISTSQNLDNGVAIETGLDNKIETLLTPSDQKAHVTLKTKFNNHAINEEVSVYNNPERLGLEVSGAILTSLLNTADSENQEFAVSGFLKYDKSTSSHVIHLPFVESVPALLEDLKIAIVSTAEALKTIITREDLVNKLESIPQHISDFVKELNVEGRAIQLKEDLLSLSREYVITLEDLEATLMNLRAALEKLLTDLAARVNDTVRLTKELIASGTLSETVVKRLTEELNALNEEYDFNAMLVAVIELVEDLIKQIDLMKLKDSSIALLHDLDAQYAIKAKLEERVGELKQMISSFSLAQFVEDLKSLILSIDIEGLTNQLVAQIPTEQINKIVDTVKSLVTELDIIGKLNVVYANVKTVLVKYELDKTVEAILEKVVELIKKFKIDETVQVVADTLKTIHIPVTLEDATNYLKATEIKQAIEHLNEYLDAFVQSVKSFDYNAFVDHANEKIAAYTAELNTLIASLEIPQKVEAAREFINYVLSTLSGLSVISLPEISLPEISLPAFPKINPEDLIDIPLTIPEIKLPHIPTELMVPAFGKLYGEIKVNTPIYNLRSAAEFQNAPESETTPQYTASLTAQGSSSMFEGLDCNLDSSASVKFPDINQIHVAESLKFTSSILAVDHEATVSLPPQGTAKTTVKITTSPITAELVNNAVIDGLSLALDTTYHHQINIALISYTSESHLSQKAAARLEGHTITLTIGHEGTTKFALPDYSDEGTLKSDLHYTMDFSTAKLTYTGDINSAILKMKQVLKADAVVLSYLNFDARVETESPIIKNSLLTASGKADLGDLKVEIKANHDTELAGALSGTLSNSIHAMIKPIEVVLDFQNKGNAKTNLADTLSAKLDLQNDYSVTLNYDHQHINTLALVKLNQYKIGYNVTVENNQAETGVYAAVDAEANLDFLTVPISIPELAVPIIDFKTPAINDINLYEHTGLKHLLTSTEQTVDVDAKIVYKKSKFAPLLDLGLIHIPAIGSLVSEASFKSSIINLNVNAEVSAEDDVVIRIGAISASVFEGLKAKIDGTSSLTTKRGVKLATTLSLENAHVQATHDSTLNLKTEELEASLSATTDAKVNLAILTAEANHHLTADTKEHPQAASTLKIKYTLDIPVIKAVGSGDAENSLKLEAGLYFLSVESSTKGHIDGTILDTGLVKGALDNTANAYLNENGLRSTLKSNGNAHISHGDLKVELDLDEDIALEAGLSRVYSTVKIDSNNEINVAALNTKGKHSAKATIDLSPLSSLAADVEVDLAQPSTLGEFSIYDKTVLELTAGKQKAAINAKIVTPVYTTTAAAEVEAEIPNAKGAFKISATSPVEFLVYDLDSSIASAVESAALSLTGKAVLTHADLNVDIQNILTAAMSDDGAFRHSVNVDISSPTFTDVNFRYAARKDGASASISTPSTGFLGLQLQGRVPSQLYARLYSRYASAPESDVEILTIRAAAKDGDRLHLQAAYNLDAPKDIIAGLEERVPAITSTLISFLDKYGIVSALESVKNTLVSVVTEAYNTAKSHAPEMSQLSVLFRDVVVQYQKTVQVLLDAAIKFLRETQIELPGMEKATLLEIVHKITTNVGTVLEQLLQVITDNLYAYLTPVVDTISKIQVTMPSGEVLTGSQVLDQVKAVLTKVVEMVKNLESLDHILEKVGQTLQDVVEKAQGFVDSLHSDILDTVSVYINTLYHNYLAMLKTVTEHVDSLLNVQEVNDTIKHALEFVRSVVDQILTRVAAILPHGVENVYLRVSNGKLEVELPFALHQ
ncbi:apolipoprotein B-100-like [Alosa pseudoharengus]|uniref:apolipoprotein B-100-like n=1 Tax=Alosa pseudoharengus TaxID=34774 RepID=UPI003F886C0C